MAEEVIHTRTFQVTVSFTDEQRDRFLKELEWELMDGTISHAIRSEIIDSLRDRDLDASVTIVERMEVG